MSRNPRGSSLRAAPCLFRVFHLRVQLATLWRVGLTRLVRMVRTTRSLECLVATAMVCGCLVWRFASPPVTPEWVELLRLRKENDRLLQRLKAHTTP